MNYRPRQPGYEEKGQGYRAWALPPGHPLAGLLSEIFYLDRWPQVHGAQVVPDGCDDLLFLLDDGRVRGYFSPSLRESHRFSFAGQGALLGVRFQPGAADNFLGKPRPVFRGSPVEGAALWRDFGDIEVRLTETGELRRKVEVLTAYLRGKAQADTERQRLLKFCVSAIVQAQGTCSVQELARRTGYTDRYLRQCFRRGLGHSPKEFAEIIRLQHLLTLLKQRPECSLADLALCCGFADQSHMNRAARAYLGHTAGQLRGQSAWSEGSRPERQFR